MNGPRNLLKSSIKDLLVCEPGLNKKFTTTTQQCSFVADKSINTVSNIFIYYPDTDFQNWRDVFCISILLNILDLIRLKQYD